MQRDTCACDMRVANEDCCPSRNVRSLILRFLAIVIFLIKGSCCRFYCYSNNKDNKQFEIPTILQGFFTKNTGNGYFS